MSSVSSLVSASNLYPTVPQNPMAKALQAFSALGNALQSNDLTSAQTALAAFQQALPTASGNSQSSQSQLFGGNSQANTAFQTLTTALQSGNLSGAQSAFSSLQTDLQSAAPGAGKTHHRGGHHHGAAAPADTVNSTSTSSSSTSTPGSSTTVPTIDNETEGESSLLNLLA